MAKIDRNKIKSLKLKKKEKKSVEEEIKAANVIAAQDPRYKGQKKWKVKSKEISLALLGALIGSFATVSIMLPNGLTYGGITGLSKIVQFVSGLNYSVAYYIFSALIILFVLISLGLNEVKKILLLTIAFPTLMMVLEFLKVEILIPDMFLGAVFTGISFGVSNGLIFQAGFSSGGSDSVAKVIKIKKFPYKSLNNITTIINMSIVVLSAFFLGINVAMYAVVTMYISMKVGDAVIYGFNEKLVQLEILTESSKELSDYVMNEMGRGVSSMSIVGEYTGDKRKQLRIICSPKESFLIKKFLAKTDPNAFVSVVEINTVWGKGRGFTNIKEDI